MFNENLSADEKKEIRDIQAEEEHYRKYRYMPLDEGSKPVPQVALNLARDALNYFIENLSDRDRALLNMSRMEECTLSPGDLYDCVRLKCYAEGLREVIRKNEHWSPREEPTKALPTKKWSPQDHNDRNY